MQTCLHEQHWQRQAWFLLRSTHLRALCCLCGTTLPRMCPQCCSPAARPTTVVTGVRFVKLGSPFAEAVCGANAYDAGGRIGGGGSTRMCVDTQRMVGDRVVSANAGKFVSNITVVIDQKPWSELACPPGYSKHNEELTVRNSGSSLALCLKTARAGTPLHQLVKGVTLDPTCREGHGDYRRVRGNVNGAPDTPLYVCVSTESVEEARKVDEP
jgi:hypothetical protein